MAGIVVKLGLIITSLLPLFWASTIPEGAVSVQLFAVSEPSNIKRASQPSSNASILVDVFKGSSRNLTQFLLSNHNPNAPPDGLIDIHYELELVHILGIDELKQTLTALVYVDERWVDHTLAWKPEDFGGLKKTWLPMAAVWAPDLIVFNMLSHEDLLSGVRAPVVVFSDGTVESSHPAVYTITCEINIKHFPLDEQRCALEIASWAYSDEKISLHAHVEHSLQHYAPNEEWFLLNVSVMEQKYEHEGMTVSEIHYEISVRRKPLFYMVTVTFPSYVMCAISIVGLFARFSTTAERQERFSLGVTAILTSAVLSLVVSEKVPHSSTSVPLLVAYFLFNMVVISVASMMTGVVMKIHRLGRYGKEPPHWLLHVFGLCVHKRFKVPKSNQKSNISEQKGSNYIIEKDLENIEWTEDLLRQKRISCSKDSALHRKLCTIELCLDRLYDLWHSTQVPMIGTQPTHQPKTRKQKNLSTRKLANVKNCRSLKLNLKCTKFLWGEEDCSTFKLRYIELQQFKLRLFNFRHLQD